MAFAGSAMASGFAAAAVSQGEGTGQKILRERKLAKTGELPLAETGGFWTFGAGVHLKAIMHSEQRTS